ncbi:MAG: GDP-mannose 4,6-dehydratase [Bacteriovoracaceae bacterium]
MYKVLVTGAAGFIGSNLVRALVEKGYEVVGIDNLSQGDLLNLSGLMGNPNFIFHKIDIREEEEVLRVANGCKRIVHLAAFKIPRYSDAMDTLKINTFGTECILNVAVKLGAKVVAASTSDVYGKNPDVPFSEESSLVIGSPTVRRWAYAISKMYDEQLMMAYHERHGLDVVIIRLFGGYGPNQNLTWWGGPQSVFIANSLEGKELEIHGDGLQTRSFTYVDDHVQGFIKCLEMDEANNQVFNIGATREITILDLSRLIWKLVRGESDEARIKIIPYESFGKYEDVRRRIPNITKARTLLGFDPKTDLETGLKKTILWQKNRTSEISANLLNIKSGDKKTWTANIFSK